MKLKFSEQSDGVMSVYFHWNILGLWFEGKPKIYYLYSWILHVLISYFYSMTMILSAFVEQNLASTTEGLLASVSDVGILLKVITVSIYQKSYRKLYKTLYSELKLINEDDLYEKELIKCGQKQSKRLLNIVLTSYYICVVLIVVKPLFSDEQQLPFKTVYPFNWKGTTYIYALTYIYQSIGIAIQVTLSAGVDTITSSVMILLCHHCDVISYNFQNLGLCDYSNSDEKRYKLFQRIAKNYILFNRVLKQLENGFSAIIFIQFCLSAIVVCTTAFQISIVSFSERKAEFIFMVAYLIAMIIQIFIPCYFGNELFLRSKALTNSLYNSNWIQFDRKFNKDIILFMEFLKKPLLMRGGIIELKLSAFLSTINFAYSIFNLLHRIQNQ